MQECSMTSSEASSNWPEGTISVRVTMNPYVFALAIDEAYKQGLKPWEFINAAIWDKLGKPDHKALMDYAANLELDDEDPKWKKRLKITAQHEIEMAAALKERAEALAQDTPDTADGNGEPA
jgi:hypothetical protein